MFFWGSHGCDLDDGHGGEHRCGGTDEDAHWTLPDYPCSVYDETTGTARHGIIGGDGTFETWSSPLHMEGSP